MEVYANFRERVVIDPKDVIQKLIDEAIGQGCWVDAEDGVLYICWEDHKMTQREETTRELYDYVQKLYDVQHYLNQNGR